MIPYVLNIALLALITYRIYIGMTEGLLNEFTNLINFLFSAGLSFTVFQSLAPYISKYIFPDGQYALVIAFWSVFIISISILWSIKQLLFSKIFEATKEKTIRFFAPIDRIGGALCGVILAINFISCLIISLYIAPDTKEVFYRLREEDKIIFRADEAYLRTYNKFINFEWQRFLIDLKPEEKEEEQEEEPQKTKQAHY